MTKNVDIEFGYIHIQTLLMVDSQKAQHKEEIMKS
jgi:hypothetical protein